MLCPGLKITLTTAKPKSKETWCYEGGLHEYLLEAFGSAEYLPEPPFSGASQGNAEAVDWALVWQLGDANAVGESYVNLIPTPQGGTHVNGLRTGLTEAVREFCNMRSILPRGVRLAPEDVWDGVSYVLSVKLEDPQFSGQTKERLSSRESAAFVSGVVKDAFSLWLNQHPETGERIAMLAISNAQSRLKAAKKVVQKESRQRPRTARKTRRLHAATARARRDLPR